MNKTQINALIATIEDNGLNTAAEVRTLVQAIADTVWRIGEIKLVKMTSVYFAANFDSTGLGILNEIGFAFSNGNNRTDDYRRKVPVGFDPTPYVSGNDYSVIGNTFGEETHVLTVEELASHHHTEIQVIVGTGAGGSGTIDVTGGNTGNTGGDEAHNNMQPSKVTVFIQRIA